MERICWMIDLLSIACQIKSPLNWNGRGKSLQGFVHLRAAALVLRFRGHPAAPQPIEGRIGMWTIWDVGKSRDLYVWGLESVISTRRGPQRWLPRRHYMAWT